MKRIEPLRIGEIIQQMIDATGMRPSLQRHTVESIWAPTVGKHIASYTGRIYVEGRALHVYIVSAVIKEELSYMRDMLVEKLNEAVGADVIDTIIFH